MSPTKSTACIASYLRQKVLVAIGVLSLSLLLATPTVCAASDASLSAGAVSSTSAVRPLTSPGTAAQVEALVAASVKLKKLTNGQLNKLSEAASDNATNVYHIPGLCNKVSESGCVFGDASSSKSIVLFGDSHAKMWLPSIIPIANSLSLKLVVLSLDACPVASLKVPDTHGNCTSFRSNAIKEIVSLKPIAVIMSDDTTAWGNFSNSQWQAGMSITLSDLAPSKSKLAIIGDIQPFGTAKAPEDILGCLAAYSTNVQRCGESNPNTRFPGRERAEKTAILDVDGTYIQPTPWLCTSNRCSAAIGTFIPYWDNNHISVTYAKYLSGVLGNALSPIL
jgi:hypothetical protein